MRCVPAPSFAATRGLALRLSLLYAAFFGVVGVQQPFWPVWLESRGLGAADIGFVLALSIGIKVVSTPLVAHLADRSGERKRLMVLMAMVSAGSFALFALTGTFWPIVAVSLVYFAAWPPTVTLAESVTLQAARAGRADYGRVRLWGSLSFIATAAIAGQALSHHPTEWVWRMIMIAQLTAAAACLLLPDLGGERRRSRRPPLAEVLADRPFVWFIVACGLIQGSHAVYYGFATLAWKAAGYSEAVIGMLWAEAVLAEVVVFAAGSRLIGRFRSLPLLALGGVAAFIRFTGLALTDALPALVLLQLLHAFSFGAAHLAAMHHISAETAPSLSATAQSLYSGGVWGLFLGAALLAAGILYAAIGSLAFLPMAGIGLIGGLLAARLAAARTASSGQPSAVARSAGDDRREPT
jgi:PPP family 3-phenylpropionic acid transporter